MADKRALALATRRPNSSSHNSLVPTRAPKSLKLEVPFQEHPLEVTRAEGLGGRACRDDLSLVHVDGEPDAAEAFSESGEEAADGRGGAGAEAGNSVRFRGVLC